MIEWMGRYRGLIEALVRHSNITARFSSVTSDVGDGAMLNSIEWQVLEYIYEHDNDDLQMSHLSERLGIAQSSFSKISKKLLTLDLIDKYQKVGNKKSIILKISPKGRETYNAYSKHLSGGVWQQFFDELDHLPQESIDSFAKAIDGISFYLSNRVHSNEEKKELILIHDDPKK